MRARREAWRNRTRRRGSRRRGRQRSRLFDPAITVARDIRTPDGVLIAACRHAGEPAGKRVTLARDVLFVDGQARGRDRLGAGA